MINMQHNLRPQHFVCYKIIQIITTQAFCKETFFERYGTFPLWQTMQEKEVLCFLFFGNKANCDFVFQERSGKRLMKG